MNIPEHVAIMMDGNGRWGKRKGLTRSQGHFAGAKAMEKIIDASMDIGINFLTLYAFSSENWKRPEDEVNYLMHLPVKFFKQKLPEFMKRNIRILVSGNIAALPEPTKNALIKAVEKTVDNTGLTVNFAFNYGGRDDILQAVRKVIGEVQRNNIDFDELNEGMFHQFLYTRDLPDPELVIRTGGEKRVSNFLLWQSCMSDLYFTDVYFPDFDKDMLIEAVSELQRRGTIRAI
ncbi:di-trans,poly-cis-decaprenylcistransferase [Virgibacillus profundi]|uniref:Isoprenyl transferase n=1 Tax=Virgibacillus profundi TaxID=2024555 RepID=A0A2A2IAC7_9BACI|nr:isoprenyl transferase [Virgibacillus profundi]PAV28286.1 di-trans,poly-cis-decaprenylcistransferase [Virgibacillus profundi]PXY52590.1 isoprenyl transferase [Virgibacillus profundi]